MTHGVGMTSGVILGGLLAFSCSSPAEQEPQAMSIASGALCEAQFDTLEKSCPVGANAREPTVADCREQQREYAGIGCQSAFDGWLECTTKAGYRCADDTGCETPQNEYFSCQARATQRTGCVRLAAQDGTRCSDAAKPYAFSCLNGAPAQCLQVVTEGAGIWCCPEL